MAMVRVPFIQSDWSVSGGGPVGAWHYVCDTEAERPTCADGCTATTKDSGKHWVRSGGAWVAPSGGSAAWGGITGTLSTQSDLQTALDAKQATSAKGQANGYASLGADGKVPSAQLPASQGSGASLTKISGATGAAGEDFTIQVLTANSADVTEAVTPQVVMTTTNVGGANGTVYKVKYCLIYQTAAVTTGIGITVNHTGAGSGIAFMWWHVTTGGAAATGVADGVASVNAGQMVEGKSERVINTVSSKTAGVDTINAAVVAILEGTLYAPASGDLQLKIVSEVAGSAVRITTLSTLELTKIA